MDKKPELVVWSEERGYYAGQLTYGSNLGAPAIKLDDDELYQQIHRLNAAGVTVIFDSPYRKLFNLFVYKMDLFDRISSMSNVIVCESFSKSLGVSGARLGFVWCNNKEFNAELNIRILYEFNGVCSISQLLVNELLTSDEGRKAVREFREITGEHIFKNIKYLKDNELLVKDIYGDDIPRGMFAIVNMAEDFLFKNRIGAVGLDKFVHHDKDMYSSYSRICLSVPNDKFVSFFDKIIKK